MRKEKNTAVLHHQWMKTQKPVNLNTGKEKGDFVQNYNYDQMSFIYGLLESYLKNNGLVVLLEVEGKDVSEHERGAALAEHVHSLL